MMHSSASCPACLLGCRSLWAGTFPDWNPYVFLGAPLATIGFWAITYPPQLLSYAIARHVMGNEFATLEVFAALHLVAGFVAMRHLCRRVGMGPMTGNLAALSFVYAGCILIMGRSWQPFIANAVWLPLLGIAVQRFREGPVGWRWILGVGLVLGLAYHSGFPQIVAILGMFLVVAVATIAYADRLPLRRLAALAQRYCWALACQRRWLIHHLGMSGGLARFVPEENGVYPALHAAVFPYPLAKRSCRPTGEALPSRKWAVSILWRRFRPLVCLASLLVLDCLADRRAWARCCGCPAASSPCSWSWASPPIYGRAWPRSPCRTFSCATAFVSIPCWRFAPSLAAA